MSEKLTKSFIDSLNLATDGLQKTYMDTVTPGFGIRIGKTSKTFIVFKRLPGAGTPKRIVLGKYGSLSVETARKMAFGALAKLANGIDVVAERRAEKAVIEAEQAIQKSQAVEDTETLGWLFKEYTKLKLNKDGKGSKGTLNSMNTCERLFSEKACQTLMLNEKKQLWEMDKVVNLESWIDRPFRSITPTEVLERFNVYQKTAPTRMQGGIWSPMIRTPDVGFKFAQSAFSWIIPRKHFENKGELVNNPFNILTAFEKWSPVGIRTRIVDFNEEEEFGSWWNAALAYREVNPVASDYILFSLLQGGRSIEIVDLKWEQVNFKTNVVTYLDTKNDLDYVFPLSKLGVEILKKRKAENSKNSIYVFEYPASETGHIPFNTYHFEQLEKFGAKIVTSHDMKRTFASAANTLPYKETEINYLLKHKVSGVNAHYFTKNKKLITSLMQDIEDLFVKTVDSFNASQAAKA